MARARRRIVVVIALWVASVPQLANAAIYRWVDDRGVPHFSDRPEDVPAAFRDQLEVIEGEEEPDAPFNVIPGLNGAWAPRPGEEGDAATRFDVSDFAETRRALEALEGPIVAVATGISLVLLGLLLAFFTVALLVSCRMVGQESPGFRKAYGIVVVQFLAGMAIGPGFVLVFGVPQPTSLGALLRAQLLQIGLLWLVHAGVLRALLCDSFGRALGLALLVNVVLIVLGVALGFLFVACAGGLALLGG